MSIQSLSIVVPGKGCINNCKFCVSRTHKDLVYKDLISEDLKTLGYGTQGRTYEMATYTKAIQYAKDLGCTTVMLTGECEPQQNRGFLNWLLGSGKWEGQLSSVFHNIEIQTTGAGLKADDIQDLRRMGINTFSLSVSSFKDNKNNSIIHTSAQNAIGLKTLCASIKDQNCLLRLSLNLNREFYQYDPEELFLKAKELGANQVTLRKLYKSGKNYVQDKWIETNTDAVKDEEYFNYIRMCGTPLEILPYGNIKYSVNGIGSVADSDCMAKQNLNDIRYLILRPDCHLYTRWDDPASIIF